VNIAGDAILYLAAQYPDQLKNGFFAAFGDARYKVESGGVVKSREMFRDLLPVPPAK
jgi:hypothetical protein